MKELISRDGYWLTQASVENESDRTFAQKVCGFGDLESLFVEWTQEQREAWETAHLDENGQLE